VHRHEFDVPADEEVRIGDRVSYTVGTDARRGNAPRACAKQVRLLLAETIRPPMQLRRACIKAKRLAAARLPKGSRSYCAISDQPIADREATASGNRPANQELGKWARRPLARSVVSETLCGNAECDRAVTQSVRGRSRKYCSDACRVRVHRRYETPGRANGHPSDLDAPRAFPTKTASFVTSKIKDFATPKNRSSASISARGIVGPKCAIEAEVINARDWEKVVSPDGVVSYVSRIGKRALQAAA
jgi:hypothetical protein